MPRRRQIHPRLNSSGRGSKLLPLLVAVGLSLWGALLYSNSLDASFHFDDIPNIVDNEHLRLDSLTTRELVEAATRSPLRARPVAYVTFALNDYFHGDRVLGYHLVNIAIHIAVAIGFFLAVLLLLRLPALEERFGSRRFLVAGSAAFLWVSHPVHVQAITYIVQRMASLAAFFVIWSLVALLWAGQVRGWKRGFGLAATLVLFLLGIGTKETAMILPVVGILGVGLLKAEGTGRARLALSLAAALAAGTAAVTLVWGPAGVIEFLTAHLWNEPRTLLTLPRAFFYNLSLLALPLPSRLSLVHDLSFSTSLVEPWTTLPALIGLLLVCALPFFTVRRDPLVSLCLSWYLILFLAEAVVVQHNPVFEHRLYLPSTSLFLLLGIGLSYLGEIGSWRAVLTATGVAVALLSVATYQRNAVWQNEITLWRDAVRKAPQATRSYPSLITALANEDRFGEAAEVYEQLASITPRYVYDHYFQGKSAYVLGRYDEAVKALTAALAMDPGHCESRQTLAEALARKGRIGEALAELRVFQEICTGESELPLARRAKLQADRLIASAEVALRARLARDPRDLEAHMLVAGLLMQRREPEAATEHLRTVVEHRPNHAAAWSNLGFCAYDLGDPRKAEEYQRRALSLAPGLANAHFGLAQALERLGHPEAAADSFRRYLALAPDHDPFRQAAQQHLQRLGQER